MRNRAFTLLESLLVIAMLVILAAMAMPLLDRQLQQRELIASAEQLRALCYQTSAEAKLRGRRLRIEFIRPPATIHQPTDEDGEPIDNAESVIAATAARVLIEREPLDAPGVFEPLEVDWARWSAPGRVQIHAVEVAEPLITPESIGRASSSFNHESTGGEQESSQLPVIVMAANGQCLVGDVTITFRNARYDGYVVNLRGATGLATIEPALGPEAEDGF
jgi:prepilin-type N-terminal cleavage/methylation domain-containing protein